MKYKIVQETKPTLNHNGEISSTDILKETAGRASLSEGTVLNVMLSMSEVINDHLRRGDKVRLEQWGMMKLEIESDKVDSPAQFKPRQHIRGVRLHFLPESEKGKPGLYKGINYEKMG